MRGWEIDPARKLDCLRPPKSRSLAASALCATALLAAFFPLTARGDLLYFRKGGQVQAPATLQDNRVLIMVPSGAHEFRRDDFSKLVPGFIPESQWAERRRLARPAGFPARYAALWWAIENGLADESKAELRELHRVDPEHAGMARMVDVLDRLQRPVQDPDLTGFRAALGIETRITHGSHVVLLHQTTDAEATQRVELLERVINGFCLDFAARGIELVVPGRRLVVAWFASQQDYRAFLHAQNADVFASTQGYYHPTWNAVVTYDARSNDRQRAVLHDIQTRGEEIEQLRAIAQRLPAGAELKVGLSGGSAKTLAKTEAIALAERLERELRREELLLELQRRAIDEGTAAHEVVHLLVANSGLLPRHDAFPIWLQEGLAMQFELVRGGRWAGISRAHDLRLPDWRQIEPPPQLDPLIRDVGLTHGYERDAYAQAWALVYYLRLTHPAEFLTLLDLFRSPDASLLELPRADRYRAVFERAFGSNLDRLERDWHQFMASVQTPLEQHAPARTSEAASPQTHRVTSSAPINPDHRHDRKN
jgi:hypothetical protein